MKRFVLTLLTLLLLAGLSAPPASAGVSEGVGAYRKGDFAVAHAELEVEQDRSPLARYMLGIMKLHGEGVPRDVAKGVALVQEAAADGYPAAQYALAVSCLYGTGVEKDVTRAGRLFAAAADGRDFRAVAYRRIMKKGSHGEKRDRKEMVETVRKAARARNPDARYTFALMYLTGDGVPKDAAREIYWYEAAATAGSPRASFTLAQMYYHGEGVPRSEQKAVRYASLAAEQRHAGAMFFLGTLYYHGRGVTVDKAKAVSWIRKAAGLGHAEAEHALGMLLFSGEGVAVDKVEGVKWLGKAARQGDEGAREVLRELVAYRGGMPRETLAIADAQAKPRPDLEGQADRAARIEGKGVVLDRGEFSLKFSGPDLTDIDAGPSLPSSPDKSLMSRLKGGKFEIIFRQ
jgi:TPR repeat protein